MNQRRASLGEMATDMKIALMIHWPSWLLTFIVWRRISKMKACLLFILPESNLSMKPPRVLACAAACA